MQQGNTSNLVFTILRMLSEVSEYHSLPAGDIICPGGPGATENIQDGDIIEAEIESIGTLRNPVKVRRIVTMMGPDSVQCKLEPGFPKHGRSLLFRQLRAANARQSHSRWNLLNDSVLRRRHEYGRGPDDHI